MQIALAHPEEQRVAKDRVRVHVVDDDPGVLDSLCWLLESQGHPVTRSVSAECLLHRLAEHPVGAMRCCLVTDLALPGRSGLELYHELQRCGFAMPVLIVTGYGDVPSAVDALTAGCVGFLQKPCGDVELLEAVAGMVRCAAARCPPVVHRVTAQDRVALLSPRELEVMHRVVAGAANREIAEELTVSPKTVEAHRSRVMEKMRARSLADLVRMAVLLGL